MSIQKLVDWVDEFEANAEQTGDTARLELVKLVREFAGGMEDATNSRQRQRYRHGLALARKLEQPWLVLLFLHGRLLIASNLQDYRGMSKLVSETMELLKHHDDFPMKTCIYHDLVRVLRARKAGRSSAKQVAELLDWIDCAREPDSHCKHCATRLRLEVALFDQEDLSAAEKFARKLCQTSGDSQVARENRFSAHLRLCLIACRRGDWPQLTRHIKCIERLVPLIEDLDSSSLAELNVWQAVLAGQQGKSHEAHDLLNRAEAKAKNDGHVPQSRDYYEGFAACYVLLGDIPAALKCRQDQLALVRDRGMPAVEQSVESEIERLQSLLGASMRN